MFKVCKERCAECLFSPGKIVDDARKHAIIESCLREQKFFICHLFGYQSEDENFVGEEVCCRGFYDSYGVQINLIRIARRLHAVVEVDQKN